MVRRKLLERRSQTGSSVTELDRMYGALSPGKRVSNTGNIYWETRKNRSDKGKYL